MFYQYASTDNGIYLCAIDKPKIEIECDSSLIAGGGNTKGYYYAWQYNQQHKNGCPHIFQLEAINIVAYKTLAPPLHLSPANVIIWTDNIKSSYALQTGRTKDGLLAACAREIWLQAARLNHHVEIKHKSGTLIPLADALSRMFHDKEKAILAHRFISTEHRQSLSSPQ